jgi:pyruvate formate lyase activating enzyme
MTKFCLYLPERSYSAMEKGIVFSIEEFAIHDGPGIRTTVFLKGCPLRCAWCHNPEGISPEPQYMDRRDGRTMCGYAICSGELAGKLLRNKAVYAMNRGGVTLTGGEPLLQKDFLCEVLHLCKHAGIHTCIDTAGCGCGGYEEILAHTDLVLLDIKHFSLDGYHSTEFLPEERADKCDK